jgi:phosphatidylserine/phosphatidylglycerophosphate/cardiolipin synthase-like enzyme
MDRVRWQHGCHTKGIVVDGARVAVGSHNWTNQGTLANRDATLIFEDAEIAAYYAEIFEFDWGNLARSSIAGARRVRAVENGAAEAAFAGGDIISWRELQG